MTAEEKTQDEHLSLYHQILSDMAVGTYDNGAPLRVHAIANRYGTSVNPVREALRRLEGEGLVKFEKNKGATMTTLDREELVNIFELIRLVEPYLVAGFAAVCTPEQVDRLEGLQEQIGQTPAIDRRGFGALDMEFHMTIIRDHYNQRAVRTWINNRRLLNTINRQKNLTKGRHKDILLEHAQLLEAFRANDVPRATEVITRHVGGAGRALIFHLDGG